MTEEAHEQPDQAPTVPAPQSSLVSQYELGDTPAPEPPAPEPAAPSAELPPRDPTTGRFVKPAHSARMVRLAKDAGLTPEEIEATAPEDLRVAVQEIMLERQASSHAATMDRALQREPEASGVHPRTPEPPTEPPDSVGADLDLDAATYEPGLVAWAQKLVARIKQLEAGQAEVRGFQQARMQESFQAQVDKFFVGHPALYGEARGQDMDRESPEYRRRIHLLEEMKRIKTGSLEERAKKAHAILHGSAPEPPKPAAKTSLEEAWEQGALVKPTHRSGAAEPPGVGKATRTVAAFQRENGAQEKTNIADEFPG